jgi:uncharacterized protein
MESPDQSVRAPSRPPERSQSSISSDRMRIFNVTRNTEVARNAEVARSGAKRSKGLLGRKCLASGEGMWIVPCEAVHTFFMKFALDLIYLDRKLRVKKVRTNVSPWRFSACLSAHSILELPCGAIGDSQTVAGDLLEISPTSGSSDPTPL